MLQDPSYFNNISKEIFDSESSLVQKFIIEQSTGKTSDLLWDSTLNNNLKSNDYLYFVSGVFMAPEDIRKTGKVSAGFGCLGNVLYCVPAQMNPDNQLVLHNFGTSVFRHRETPLISPVVFQYKATDVSIGNINYLGKGHLYHHLLENNDILCTNEYVELFNTYRTSIESLSVRILQDTRQRLSDETPFKDSIPAKLFIDTVSELVPHLKFLSYVYFEAISLCLMLNSVDNQCVALYSKGELNNSLYIDFYHEYKTSEKGNRFEAYGFSPNSQEVSRILFELTKQGLLEINDHENFIIKLSNILSYYIGITFPDTESLHGFLFHDFCISPEHRAELKPAMDKNISSLMTEYMNRHELDIVVNSTIRKGEYGICPNSKNACITSLATYSSKRDSVRILEQTNLSIIPIWQFSV